MSSSGYFGPTDRHCQEWSIKYDKELNGRYILKECLFGTYIAEQDNVLICLPCDESCLTCSRAESFIGWKEGYLLIEDKQLYKTCKKVNSEYYTDKNNQLEGNSFINFI